ncbi:hypothetical protein CN198_14350 [Sinorhizobium meliloti]|uniref:hypothetical protein n=1 Tax=Rhizobium meliloti TaxID=382 RepID=UPI000FD74347|nr:hypothetical protein [Sinorhizobium meliloti]RVH69236.1 hypothetical protein CN198_14350 [Sinorhizobium meliloti]
MESNVISFADRLQARQQAKPTWFGLAHATEIEIMMREIGQTNLEVIISTEQVRNYAIGNIDIMDADTYRLLLEANNKLNQAVGLIMQATYALDLAAKNENRGGDNCVDLDLPDFHDCPA